jgi:hypothetical protein
VDDRHSAYRKYAQKYSEEEHRLWEDLRHGIFLGTPSFTEKIKKRHLPDVPHAEIPAQKKLKKSFDADAFILKAAKILNCDPCHYRKALRISAAEKVNRDLLIYLLWHTGQLTNKQIGEKFGLSYSAVSSRVRIFKGLLKNNRELENKFDQIKSLIKI